MTKKGFTVIELLAVIVLVAILTSVALHFYFSNTAVEGKAYKTIEEISKLKRAINSYYEDTGYYPANAKQLWKNDLGTEGWNGKYVVPPFGDDSYDYFPLMPYGGEAWLECSDGNYLRLKMKTTKVICSIMDENFDDKNLSSGRITFDGNYCYYYFYKGSDVACH